MKTVSKWFNLLQLLPFYLIVPVLNICYRRSFLLISYYLIPVFHPKQSFSLSQVFVTYYYVTDILGQIYRVVFACRYYWMGNIRKKNTSIAQYRPLSFDALGLCEFSNLVLIATFYIFLRIYSSLGICRVVAWTPHVVHIKPNGKSKRKRS